MRSTRWTTRSPTTSSDNPSDDVVDSRLISLLATSSPDIPLWPTQVPTRDSPEIHVLVDRNFTAADFPRSSVFPRSQRKRIFPIFVPIFVCAHAQQIIGIHTICTIIVNSTYRTYNVRRSKNIGKSVWDSIAFAKLIVVTLPDTHTHHHNV